MANIKIIEVNSEIGAGTRGASLGVPAIKIAALDFGSVYFKHYPPVEIPNENHLLLEPDPYEHAKRINGIVAMYNKVSEKVKKTLKAGNFPLVLSGDHCIAGGTIAGIKMAYPNKRLGVIWIDAHADMHSPYTSPSGNVHGMPLAVSLGEDNLKHKVNNVDAKTAGYWNQLKKTGGIVPKIDYSDLVLMAVRDTEAPEKALIKKHNVKNFAVSEIRKKGVDRIGTEALTLLKECDMIYVSFDVDSMDSSISKGTGTPVPNGITEKEAGNLVARLMKSKKIAGLEIVEVNPTLDKENLMAENAFEILQKATNQLKTVL